MRSPLTCERVCIAQMDPKLTSFVTALSEISSGTKLTYGPDTNSSGGAGESEISSLTDPSNGSGCGIEADSGVGKSAIAVSEKSSPTDPSNGSSMTDPSKSAMMNATLLPREPRDLLKSSSGDLSFLEYNQDRKDRCDSSHEKSRGGDCNDGDESRRPRSTSGEM